MSAKTETFLGPLIHTKNLSLLKILLVVIETAICSGQLYSCTIWFMVVIGLQNI